MTTTHERAALIARKMASMNFVPIASIGGTHVEYQKDYEHEGRHARVTTMFVKDPTGRREAQLDGFVLTVQMHVSIDEASVKKVPLLVRPDVSEIYKALGPGPLQPTHVVEAECANCATLTSELFVVKGKKLCRHCHG